MSKSWTLIYLFQAEEHNNTVERDLGDLPVLWADFETGKEIDKHEGMILKL